MILHRTALLCLALTPLITSGQTATPIAQMRNRAIAEGSVEVTVTSRAVAQAPLSPSARTQAQRFAIQLAQQKILMGLLPRGLVVGNEINAEPDGTFSMRVLPDAVDVLAASPDVIAVRERGSSDKEAL